jgi:P4 family phage/plasmid primase-like protien
MRPIETYFELIHKHTPATAVIGLTTISGTYVNTRWYQRQHIARLIEDALAIGPRSNVYARMTPLSRPPDAGRGLERDSIGAGVLWVDLDSYANPIAGLQALEAFAPNGRPMPPSLIVNSGNGLHAYWLLDRFYTDLEAIKARTKQLAIELNRYDPTESADSCYDLARILRLVQTYNVKRPDQPLECTLVHANPAAVYALEDFEAATLTEDSAIVVWDCEPLPGDFIESVRERDAKLARRILTEEGAKKAEAPINGDGKIDRSRNDAFIVTRLLALGYTAGVCLSVLQSPDWFSGDKYRQRRRYDYVLMTVNAAVKAYQQSADRYFTKSAFQADRLGEELNTGGDFIYTAERLWRYVGGVYRPDAEHTIKAEVIKRLGRRWSSRASDETVRYIIDRSRVPLESVNDYEWLINCANGMLDVKTRELLPHDPRYRSTIQLPAAYDPHADTSAIDKFFADIVPADAIPMLWEYIGSAFMMREYTPKAFIALVGPGDSGKSKLLEWLINFYGGEYNVAALSLQTLADNRFAASKLYGKVANIFSDLDSGEASNTGQIKSLTGDDYVTGEEKFKGVFMFKNFARLFFSANDYPAVRNPDEAYFRRAFIVPCRNHFAPKTADPKIVRKLTTPANLAAGLLRACEGLARLLAQNEFTPSPSVEAANTDYRFNADTVAGFLHTCSFDDNAVIAKQDLYQVYRLACVSGGRKAVSEDKFFKRVADNKQRFGITEEFKTRPDKTRFWAYCGIRPPQLTAGPLSYGMPDFSKLPADHDRSN